MPPGKKKGEPERDRLGQMQVEMREAADAAVRAVRRGTATGTAWPRVEGAYNKRNRTRHAHSSRAGRSGVDPASD